MPGWKGNGTAAHPGLSAGPPSGKAWVTKGQPCGDLEVLVGNQVREVGRGQLKLSPSEEFGFYAKCMGSDYHIVLCRMCTHVLMLIPTYNSNYNWN